MSFSKADQFTQAQQELASLAKALSHPGRIAILEFLAADGTCVCGDIVDHLPLSQATVSQHLKVLRDAGLVQGTIEGPRTCYCLDMVAFSAAFETLSAWFGKETEVTTRNRDSACCQTTQLP